MSNVIFINEPKRTIGSAVPLFEKLRDDDPSLQSEHPVLKFYDENEIFDSIQRELYHVFGTQASMRKEDYLELSENPIYYGLPEMFGVPEFTCFEATNKDNWKDLALHLVRVIEAYEPRLSKVRVIIQYFDKETQKLHIEVKAMLSQSHVLEEATFFLSV